MFLKLEKVLLGCLLLIMTWACGGTQGPAIIKALNGDWTTTNILGEVETVRFVENRILWHYGTENQYECPYQVCYYHETERYVCLGLWSERRTGADTWIEHRLQLNESFDEFIMAHGKNFETIDGIFKARKI